MIFSNIIRKLLSFLSFWYQNKIISHKKDEKIRNYILKKIKLSKIDKKNLKKTHQEFNKEISQLISNSDLKNFLRKNFIQKMFFLQNRFFVYKELKILQKSKKWNFYKNLLKEDDIGNPIRYFLYPYSSGNLINHVYHLNIFEDEFKINLKKDIKKVFEFGGGYGCMARIFSKINSNVRYTCFDTHNVNLLQYYYLKHNNLDVGFENKNTYFLTSKFHKIMNNSNLFIANWSLSETPLEFRKKFNKILLKNKFILICFQEKFEDIDNLKYFQNLRQKLLSKFNIKIIKNKFYKGNFLFKQNHYFFIGKKY